MRRRGRAQLENPFVRGVVRLPVFDRANARVRRDLRRREIGLARAQVDHVFAGRLAALGFGGDRNRGRCLEVLQVGGQTFGHRGMAPERLRIITVESTWRARTTPRYPRTVSARNNEFSIASSVASATA